MIHESVSCLVHVVLFSVIHLLPIIIIIILSDEVPQRCLTALEIRFREMSRTTLLHSAVLQSGIPEGWTGDAPMPWTARFPRPGFLAPLAAVGFPSFPASVTTTTRAGCGEAAVLGNRPGSGFRWESSHGCGGQSRLQTPWRSGTIRRGRRRVLLRGMVVRSCLLTSPSSSCCM